MMDVAENLVQKKPKKQKKEKKEKKEKKLKMSRSDLSDSVSVPSVEWVISDGTALPTNGNVVKKQAVAESEANAIENFELLPQLEKALRDKGFTKLFPIQAATFPVCTGGYDLVGRAKTGSGKTLAFVLPVVQMLIKENKASQLRGRTPSVLVMAPTRELAKQVEEDFNYIGGVVNLQTLCVYGGTPYNQQCQTLRNGVDIVVGTPGRLKDLIEKQALKLSSLRFRILDECDEMLNMGFKEDVEEIFNSTPSEITVTTLLFSATLPDWVQSIMQRFLQKNYKVIDLVGEKQDKINTDVTHYLIACPPSEQSSIIPDLIRVYGVGGRTIVFVATKSECDELAALLSATIGARAIHGDVAQGQREATLNGFRDGKFKVLVATDVAARGLDISGVDLIIQNKPPNNVESYIHRSGRTGRAGASGVSILLYTQRSEYLVKQIEQHAKFKFIRVGIPQPSELAKMSGENAVKIVCSVEDEVVEHFLEAAQMLLDKESSPQVAVAKTLAKLTGFDKVKTRSLLAGYEDCQTLEFRSAWQFERAGFVYNFLRKYLPEQLVEEVRRMTLTEDNWGAVFDVPVEKVDQFLQIPNQNQHRAGQKMTIQKCKELPALQVKPEQNGYSGRGGRGGGYGGTGVGRGRGWGARGSYSNGNGTGGRGGFKRKWDGGGRGFSKRGRGSYS
eukprot:TRINITY_DN1433_c0_g2_i1.p1 TRINITY_DN1433_c0_g2~~TRINITY_DN1433_c0_g2_i1.p1  ORF type:complete len:674 (+),score=97.19 TRINITY_DN1433_c0_g2_i1:44-2065(+)